MAGMISHIVVIEPTVTVVAEVGFADEPFEGITPIVVFTLFDETNDLVRGDGSLIDDHLRRINGHHLDLVPRQGILKLSKFGETTGTFRNSR